MKTTLLIIALLATGLVSAQDTTNFSQTDKVLAKAIEKGIALAEKTGEFVIEQAPDLLQQFFAWRIAAAIFWILFAIGLMVMARRLPYLWLSKEQTHYDNRFFGRYGDEGGFLAWAMFIICSIISLIVFLCNVYEILFISLAPKLYLIDYFASMARGCGH